MRQNCMNILVSSLLGRVVMTVTAAALNDLPVFCRAACHVRQTAARGDPVPFSGPPQNAILGSTCINECHTHLLLVILTVYVLNAKCVRWCRKTSY